MKEDLEAYSQQRRMLAERQRNTQIEQEVNIQTSEYRRKLRKEHDEEQRRLFDDLRKRRENVEAKWKEYTQVCTLIYIFLHYYYSL